MIKLDDNFLAELGLGALPPEEKKKMVAVLISGIRLSGMVTSNFSSKSIIKSITPKESRFKSADKSVSSVML